MDREQAKRILRAQDKKRIKYIQGLMMGKTSTIKTAIADDLIARGYAVDLDREPGEEG